MKCQVIYDGMKISTSIQTKRELFRVLRDASGMTSKEILLDVHNHKHLRTDWVLHGSNWYVEKILDNEGTINPKKYVKPFTF